MTTASWMHSGLTRCCLCLSLLAAPSVAFAGDKALAESFFQDGKRLMEEGKYDQACGKFESSQKQDPSPGTLLNLGKCNEARGKNATAWANYKEAEALARNMSRTEQEELAAERAKAVEPKLSHLEIKPPATLVEGLRVTRDGIEIGVDTLGSAMPVDPGEHLIEASAPGYQTWKGKVTVGKEADKASIAIPELTKSAEPTPPVGGAAAGAGPTGGAQSATADSGKAGGSTKTIGFVLTGVGAVALLAGGYFGYAASKQATDAENDQSLCPNKQCTPAGRDEIDSAKGKALLSTIGVGLGVAALGAGIVLIVTAPSSKETAPAAAKPYARVTPLIGPQGGGLSFGGAF